LASYSTILQPKPGKSNLKEHTIDVGNARQVPYRIPHTYRDVVKRELTEMLEAGIIIQSSSPHFFWLTRKMGVCDFVSIIENFMQ